MEQCFLALFLMYLRCVLHLLHGHITKRSHVNVFRNSKSVPEYDADVPEVKWLYPHEVMRHVHIDLRCKLHGACCRLQTLLVGL